MSWTYAPLTGGSITAGSVSEIRLVIGDTVAADPLLQDEEIAYFMGLNPTMEFAAAKCCEAIAAVYSRLADSSIGDVSQSMSQKSAQYRALAQELRRKAPISMTFGGISQSAKDAVSSDTDSVQPVFKKGEDDNPGTRSDLGPTPSGNANDPFGAI